ncbi:MAG: hypothetical protein ACK5XX_05900 [Holosporales bacterium]|jgi:hypothetical protein
MNADELLDSVKNPNAKFENLAGLLFTVIDSGYDWTSLKNREAVVNILTNDLSPPEIQKFQSYLQHKREHHRLNSGDYPGLQQEIKAANRLRDYYDAKVEITSPRDAAHQAIAQKILAVKESDEKAVAKYGQVLAAVASVTRDDRRDKVESSMSFEKMLGTTSDALVGNTLVKAIDWTLEKFAMLPLHTFNWKHSDSNR